ncbi:MAG: hypothetical protein HKN04_02780, partial [Rhodothermaceae bacterium]|nr:hypothetical protein [Rhodothermaceae bacterium]
ALNEALATVEQGLVVFFDDDVRLSPGVLVAYAEAAAEYPEHGAYFGGPFGVDYEERPPEWLIPLLPWSARGLNLKTGPKAPFYLGFNWAAFTSDIHKTGGFNPNYGPGSPIGAGGQETNMQRRMRDLHIEGVDVLDAHVWHYVPRQSCTPDWALQRAYRAGLTRGVEARRRRRTRFMLQQVKRVTLALPDVVPHLLRRDSPEWYKAVIPIAWPLAIIRAYVRPPRPALQESKRLEGTETP